jgi:hypothetical protein
MKQLLLDQPTDSMQHPADSNPVGDNGEAAAAGDESAAIVPKQSSQGARIGTPAVLLRGEGAVRWIGRPKCCTSS